MRLAYLIAGAGGMYCGSCLRDNRLAATLIEQGRDVVLVPLYTPIRTDEVSVSTDRVYYGGINVFLQQKSALFRALPGPVARLLDAPSLLRRAMRLAGNTKPADLGELTVSMLRGQHGAQRAELAKLVAGLRAIKPDVVCLPNLMFVGLAAELKRSLGATVLCTLSGEDIFVDALPEPHRTRAHELIERGARDVDGFVAVSNYYAAHATGHFRLPGDRVHVVEMGVRMDDAVAPAAPADGPFTIGYLARICPEKGLANLVGALVRLREAGRDCRVRAAGYLAPGERAYLDEVRALIARSGAGDAFEYLGEVDRDQKFAMLRSLHVLSVPTVYHEAKGLYVLEALACGVPVVQPRHGAFPELIEATGGGLLYDASDAGALAEAIASLMDDEPRRRELGESGRSAVRSSFTDTAMADRMWALMGRWGAAD